MGIPSISARRGYRVVPAPFAEETDTLVLTSKDGYFVDIRLWSAAYEAEKGSSAYSDASVQWAFAGRSRVTNPRFSEDGRMRHWHNVWEHSIDSHTHRPEEQDDSAEMEVREDGLVLEKGSNLSESTGKMEEYEELWQDLDVGSMGTKGNKSSIVVRTEDQRGAVQGRVVKVGGYCQGMLRDENTGRITLERWRKVVEAEDGKGYGDARTRTRNDWIRVFRCGAAVLPCKAICSNTDGKMGGNAVMKDEDGIQWRVIEEYYF